MFKHRPNLLPAHQGQPSDLNFFISTFLLISSMSSMSSFAMYNLQPLVKPKLQTQRRSVQEYFKIIKVELLLCSSHRNKKTLHIIAIYIALYLTEYNEIFRVYVNIFTDSIKYVLRIFCSKC